MLHENRIAYERAMLQEQGGCKAEQFDLQPGGSVFIDGSWLLVVRVNKKGGQVVSVTTNARYVRTRAMEEIQDYQAPSEEAAARMKQATKLAPLVNYPAPGAVHMTKEEWAKIYKDCKGSKTVPATDEQAACQRQFKSDPLWLNIANLILTHPSFRHL